MRVLVVPDFESNPYFELFDRALSGTGARVERRKRLGNPFAMRGGRPHVVHVHFTHPFTTSRALPLAVVRSVRFILWAWFARLAGARIVWTLHNLRAHETSHARLERATNAAFARLCHALIAHCEAAAHEARTELSLGEGSPSIHVIPHPNFAEAYPPAQPRAQARAKVGLPAEGCVFLFLGQLRPYKGIAQLIEGFAQVRDPTARLVIAGKPHPMWDADAARRRAQADGRVVLVERYLDEDEVSAYLGAANAAVFAYQEVFTSGAAILAASLGRAIIAPRLGCIPETFPRAGVILFERSDPASIARAIDAALGADLDRMGLANRQAMEKVPWSLVAARTREAYGR